MVVAAGSKTGESTRYKDRNDGKLITMYLVSKLKLG